MSESRENVGAVSADARDGEIDLFEIALTLARHKKLLLRLPAIVAAIALVGTLLWPKTYTGITKILPPQQGQSTAAAMLGQLTGQLGNLGNVAGNVLGIKNPNDMYIGMLKSRTVADRLIDRFDLKKIYDEKTYQSARKDLENRTEITSGKDGIIKIEVDDRDPKRAAALANGYVEELYNLTKVLAVTEASQRRLFYEKQLALAQENMTKAEEAARRGLEKGGVVAVYAQGTALIEATARLRAQISVKEIQIDSMRTFAGDQNPDLRQALHELEAMKRELAKVEGVPQGGVNPESDKPDGMKNLKLLRDVKYHELVYELLAKQYEFARIDEAKDASLIQVLDKALEPERKSKPKRMLIVLLSTLAAFFVAVFLAFILDAYRKAISRSENQNKVEEVRRHFGFR